MVGLINLSSSCTNATGDNFIDERDQQVYELVSIGNQTWFASDLKFKTLNSLCYDNDPKNCQSFGQLYNFSESKMACPEGWKLPNDSDWKTLEIALGMDKQQSEAIRVWRGINEGKLMKEKLQVTYSGMGKSMGREFIGKDILVNYWVNSTGPSGAQYGLYRMLQTTENRIYSDQAPKMNLCCVRCLKI